MFNSSKLLHKIWLSSIFLITISVFLFTLFPTVTSEDSGELITAAYHLGIPHPPGYPLFMLLGKLGTIIIPFGNIAWRVNVVSAILGALTSLLLASLIFRISKNRVAATSGALVLAFTNIFWSQSVRAEIYTLAALVFVGVIYLCYLWSQTKSQKEQHRLLMWCSFLLGLGAAAHQYLIAIIPALVVYFLIYDRQLWKQYKVILKGLLLYLLGFSIYLYLPIRSLADPVIDWGNPETLENFWQVFRRQTYQEYVPSVLDAAQAAPVKPNFSYSNYLLVQGPKFITHFAQLLHRLNKYLFIDFTVFGFALGVTGLVAMRKIAKPMLTIISCIAIWYAAILTYFQFGHVTGSLTFTNIPFYIPFHILFAIAIGLGADFCWNSAKKSKSIRKVIFGSILLVPLIVFTTNFQFNNQRGNYLVYDYVKAVINQVPRNGLLYLHQGDNSIFPATYLRHVENFRPDVEIIARTDSGVFPGAYYLTLAQQYPGKSIYTDSPGAVPALPPGHQANNLGYVTHFRLSPTPVPQTTLDQLYQYAANYTPSIRGLDHPHLDFWHSHVAMFTHLSQGFLGLDRAPAAREVSFAKAYSLKIQERDILARTIIHFYLQLGQQLAATPHTEQLIKMGKANQTEIISLALLYIQENDFESADHHLGKIYTSSPAAFTPEKLPLCETLPPDATAQEAVQHKNACDTRNLMLKYADWKHQQN